MHAGILYAIVVLIWGSTWWAIKLQLGDVAEEMSVAYRFGLASVLLFIYAAVTDRTVGLPRDRYLQVFLQGALMFAAAYFFVYYGTAYLTTGLVAVTFSLIVPCNAFFERLFFNTPLEARLLVAAILGLAGIMLVFWPEVSSFSLEDQTMFGVVLVAVSVVLASLGNMSAIANTSRNLPVVLVNAHAMAWGALVSFVVAVVIGRPINFSLEPGYVLSLLYLAIFGSCIAFGCYLALLRAIGSARAAYTSVLYPLIALVISTFIEDFRWTLPAFAGIVLIAAGNWLALTRIKRGLNQ